MIYIPVHTEKTAAKHNKTITDPKYFKSAKASAVTFKDRTKSVDMTNYPKYFTGLLTGERSNITVVDIDIPKPHKDEKDGMKKFRELIKKLDVKTRVVKSPSGGLHYYFKYDVEIPHTTGFNGYSIDVRNNGGYIVCPPSKNYVLRDDHDICEMPQSIKQWLLLHKKKKVKPSASKKEGPDPVPEPKEKDMIYSYEQQDIVRFLNKLPKKYADDRKLWIEVTAALKSENLKDIWVKWSKQSESYNKEKNKVAWGMEPKTNIAFLLGVAKENKLKVKINTTRKLELFTAKPDETVKSKYLNLDKHDIIANPNLVIKSGTGTGKTTATTKLIKSINKDGGYKVLSIVSRVSLARQHKKNFKTNDIKLTDYLHKSEDQLNRAKNLVIQLDSLVKLDIDCFHNTIIFLDEINSIIEYLLNSTTLRAKRQVVFNLFFILLKQASHIVACDADVSDLTLLYFKNLDIDVHLIHNTYKNCKGIKAVNYSDKNRLIGIMKTKLKKDEKFVACFDSLTEQDLVVQELKDYCKAKKLEVTKDFMVYSSKDGDDKDLEDVTAKWENKWVFYSPKIVYGVDNNNVNNVDVFMVAKCSSVNPLQFSQMVARTRNIKKLHYWVQNKNNRLCYNTVNEVEQEYKSLLKGYNGTVKSLDKSETTEAGEKLKCFQSMQGLVPNKITGEWELDNVVFNNLFYLSELYGNIMGSNMKYHFAEILKEKGYEVVNDEAKATSERPDEKLTKDKVQENNANTIERALTDELESMTSSELKIRQQIESRAKILNVKIQNKEYYDELTDNRAFTEHLNVSHLINTNVNGKLVSQSYKEFGIQCVKSNTLKVKLIRDVATALKVQPLNFADAENGKVDKDTKSMVLKVFRLKESEDWSTTLRKMIKQVAPSLTRSHCPGGREDRTTHYEVNTDSLKRHLELIELRNDSLMNIDRAIIKMAGFESTPAAKLF